MRHFIVVAVLVTLYMWTPGHSSPIQQLRGMEAEKQEGTDIVGWHGITWGMHPDDASRLFREVLLVQNPKFEVGSCFFSHAIPLTIHNESWQAWLCEGRASNKITGVAIERGYNGVVFDVAKSQTQLFDTFLKDLTALYGPAHRYWRQCHNSRWHRTEQYSWYFKSTTISLIHRDVPKKHVAVHFHTPRGPADFGPGICPLPPLDLRNVN